MPEYTITVSAPESGVDSNGYDVSGMDIVTVSDVCEAIEIITKAEADGMIVTYTGTPFADLAIEMEG